jgi:hypothetical protein
MKLAIDVAPSADFMSCLFPALIAAVPQFLQSFMSCISGGGSSTGYKPGDRPRCN